AALQVIRDAHPGGLVMIDSATIAAGQRDILALAAQERLPTMSGVSATVAAGVLMSYGANGPALARRAATYVDKILKAVAPSDLPIEQPTVFYSVLNLKTAHGLGLTIPEHVLLQATAVLQ